MGVVESCSISRRAQLFGSCEPDKSRCSLSRRTGEGQSEGRFVTPPVLCFFFAQSPGNLRCMRDTEEKMIEAARELGAAVARIQFTTPITHVYNPLDYAWPA